MKSVWVPLLMLLLLAPGCARTEALHGSVYETPVAAGALSLTTTEGEPFLLDELKGHVVLLFFGYTSCPDVCPATLSKMRWIFQQLDEMDREAKFVFVTVDPERDTAQVTGDYLSRFDPRFIGLLGSPQQIERAKEAYGVFAQRDPGEAANYSITHTSRVFLIDQSGTLRSSYTFDETAETILSDIVTLTGG